MAKKTKTNTLGINIESTFSNKRLTTQQLIKVKQMSMRTEAPSGFPGWRDGTFDRDIPGTRLHQVVLTYWVTIKDKKRKRKATK